MMGAATVLARATLDGYALHRLKEHIPLTAVIPSCLPHHCRMFYKQRFFTAQKTFCLIALRKRKSKMIVFGLFFLAHFLLSR